MSLETQTVIPAHKSIEEICELAEHAAERTGVSARPTHNRDYWIVEIGDGSDVRVLNAFLNSYASDTTSALTTGPSTLLTMRLDPVATGLMRDVARATGGWHRRHEGEAWSRVYD